MDIFATIANQIIKEQENIIGPIAYEQAQKVKGIKINVQTHEVALEGDKKNILDNLVKQYETLFGQASVEVCKEAASRFSTQLSMDQLPSSLR